MKLAVLADIHGNQAALEAVLQAARRAAAQRVVCLGDVVGYGPDPAGCIRRLAEVEAVMVLGNHDQAMLEPGRIRWFNRFARHSLIHSRSLLGADELRYLAQSAFRRGESGAVFAHANPLRPEDWELLYTHEQVSWCMERLDWQVAFVGHTHHAALYCRLQSHVVPLTSTSVAIGPHQYLVNPGSVGQPRDGDWRASFALWDVDGRLVQLQRVEYDVQRAQAGIAALDWPPYLAERLGRGE
ncbi:MAG: metallophosphoesterase family protein [Candidatus Latescibacterota bacterium]